MNRSAKDGARSSPHYGGEDICVPFRRTKVCAPIVARSKTNPPQRLSCAASVLARCAGLLRLPVHHSVVPEGGKAPEVLPDLAKETEGAPQFARMTADPFLDPQTREAMNAVKRPVPVSASFATEAVLLDAAL